MTDTNETRKMWRAHKRSRQRASEKRRDAAEESIGALKTYAARHGVILTRFTDAHYQIIVRGVSWMWNIYPGNRRVYVDEHHIATGTPQLRLPDGWTLRDAVDAVRLLCGQSDVEARKL